MIKSCVENNKIFWGKNESRKRILPLNSIECLKIKWELSKPKFWGKPEPREVSRITKPKFPRAFAHIEKGSFGSHGFACSGNEGQIYGPVKGWECQKRPSPHWVCVKVRPNQRKLKTRKKI